MQTQRADPLSLCFVWGSRAPLGQDATRLIASVRVRACSPRPSPRRPTDGLSHAPQALGSRRPSSAPPAGARAAPHAPPPRAARWPDRGSLLEEQSASTRGQIAGRRRARGLLPRAAPPPPPPLSRRGAARPTCSSPAAAPPAAIAAAGWPPRGRLVPWRQKQRERAPRSMPRAGALLLGKRHLICPFDRVRRAGVLRCRSAPRRCWRCWYRGRARRLWSRRLRADSSGSIPWGLLCTMRVCPRSASYE